MSAQETPEVLVTSAAEALRGGRPAEAEALCRQALALRPRLPGALHVLARIRFDQGEAAAALSLLEEALAAAPGDGALHNSRAFVLQALGREDEARTACRSALAVAPDLLDACLNLAMLGAVEEAEAWARRIVARQPDAEAWRVCGRLGTTLLECRRYGQAVAWLHRALRLRPAEARLWERLGLALRHLMRFREAEAAYREALRLAPDFAAAHSALLSMLGYHVLVGPRRLLEEHQDWDRRHGGGEARLRTFSHGPRRDGERLRIGYVSPDFYRHAVSSFMEPLLEYHDRARVEVYCYAEVPRPDEITRRLRARADVWRSTVGLDDEAVARMIHADGIDVLVDLAGHSHADRSRIRVFTYKPAPVQVTYLGYFSTTGLRAMDYWIVDEVTVPPDSVELAVEQIYRLPRCCVSYRPPVEAPPVAPRPAGSPLTFGCFNDVTKIGDEALRCWGRILQALPAARLVLKAGQLADPGVRAAVTARLAAHGVAAGRLSLLPPTPGQAEHMACYGQVDIALDTAPRTGVTTTADALWMGVPVITLAGARFIERLGASLLHSVGLESCIASDADDYVARALALAEDAGERRRLRETLRARLAASSLCDGRGLARALESAYQEMWAAWRSARRPSGPAPRG